MSGPTGYIGSKLSLISKAEIRYEGILCSIDPVASTVTLAKVKSLGTEDRLTDRPSAPRDEIFEYIIFRGSDIKDIHVCDTCIQQDPAIIRTGESQPATSSSSSAGCFSPAYQQFNEYNNYSQYSQANSIPPSPSAALPSASQASSSVKNTLSISGVKPGSSTVQKSDVPHSSQNDDRKSSKDFHSPNKQGQRNPQQNSQSSYGHNMMHQNKREPSFRDYTRNENYPRDNFNHMNYDNRDYMRYRQARGVMNGLPRGGMNPRLFRGPDGFRGPRGMRGLSRGNNRNNRGQQKTPLKFDTEFDFEVENAKFDKTEIEEELKKLIITDDAGSKLTNGEKEEGVVGEEEEDEEEDGEVWYYDKSKSFFDKISCEATERAKGRSTRIDWREERRTNAETFGVSAIIRRGRRGRGGFRGGFNYRGGNFRGRGVMNTFDSNRGGRGTSILNRGNKRNQGWVDYDYNYEEAGIHRRSIPT